MCCIHNTYIGVLLIRQEYHNVQNHFVTSHFVTSLFISMFFVHSSICCSGLDSKQMSSLWWIRCWGQMGVSTIKEEQNYNRVIIRVFKSRESHWLYKLVRLHRPPKPTGSFQGYIMSSREHDTSADTLNTHRCCEPYFTSCNNCIICPFWVNCFFKQRWRLKGWPSHRKVLKKSEF